MALVCMVCSLNVSADDLKLWYSRPATVWTEALPLGNSRLGVMVYGGAGSEELQLNEETVWGGGPHRNDNPKLWLHYLKSDSLCLRGVIGKHKKWWHKILKLRVTVCLIKQ